MFHTYTSDTMAASRLWLLLAVVPLLAVLRTRRGPARTTIIKPDTERVVLLGASSGVGRDLAHAYAKRGARMSVYSSFSLSKAASLP